MSQYCAHRVHPGLCPKCSFDAVERLRAEVADLKARIREVRKFLHPCGDTDDDCAECRMWRRITDLRAKNWRKP